MRKSFGCLLACLLTIPLNATLAEDPPKRLKIEVEPKARITKHVLMVVDRSGSMQGDPLTEAFGIVSQFMKEPIDELQVGIIAFSDGTTRWPGVPEKRKNKPVPDGWAAFPSKAAFQKAQKWLNDLPARGGTNIAPALREALSEPRSELTILVITDGKFPDAQTNILAVLIAESQAEREKLGHSRAVIVAYGIPCGAPAEASLVKIAEAGEGGYFREIYEDDPSQQDTPR